MISTYVIDDELNCTEVLCVLLKRYCPDISIDGVFNDPEEALLRIKSEPPQLVFIDIEMPRLNSFDLLQQCLPLKFKVVFTTGYDQYAVRAIKFNALDYLLKPIDKDELIAAVEKVKLSAIPAIQQITSSQYHRFIDKPERLAIAVGQELVMIEVIEIIYFESDGSYVTIYLTGQNKPILVTKSLREFEEILNNDQFYRVHNSYLINLKYLKKILRNDSEIIMSNEKILPIARSKKQDLLSRITRM